MKSIAESIEADELPDGWSVKPLGEVVSKLTDGSHNPPKKKEFGQMMLSARNVENNKIVFDKYRYISDDDFAQENKRTRVTPGDVLLTIVGTIGRSAIVPKGLAGFALQRSVAVITPTSVLPKYLMYQFQSGFIQRYFEENARGTAQKGVYLKTLSKTPIRVAPKDQQERIVAEIEKQFSRLDEAVASLKRVKANLKRYKAAVLKAAVEGKLTEEWRKQNPDVEPASKLLERILAERRTKWEKAELAKMKAKCKEPKDDKWKDQYKEVLPADASLLPTLPKGWGASRLDSIAEIIDSLHKTPSYSDSGLPMVRVTDVKGGLLKLENAFRVSESVFAEFTRRHLPTVGDIVLSRVGTYGKASLVKTEEPFCLGQNTAILSPRLDPDFLHKALESRSIQYQMDRAVVGTTQKTISLKNISSLAIPMPPAIEQKLIVDIADEKLSVITGLEEELGKGLRRILGVRRSILQTAFSGSFNGDSNYAS